ncbi:acetylcholinesterase-1-like isoform X4 [Ornithodoros turicata]|uniref:acetylcholinesterase-1-like isoform X4 n=1 Tax=Ornithodoros turicata TaxID=34597 RepID=UPI003138F474
MGVHIFQACAVVALLQISSGLDTSIVQTALGPLKGTRLTKGNDVVDAYLGIPFAEPPIGERRFRKPVRASPWKGVLDATRMKPGCVQTDIPLNGEVTEDMSSNSEDCLYVNIWIPRSLCTDRNGSCPRLPVFVFLYGGFFMWGSSSNFEYNGFEFARRTGVIFVSFNYRVGIFGFLNASLPDAPGNQGLYDQLEALKWIRANIGFFGGNEDEITLAGQSAGAISISYHMTSNLTKGMFKRAVLLSGTPSTVCFHVDVKDIIRRSAESVNCLDLSKEPELQYEDIVKCFRKLNARTMVNTLEEALMSRYTTMFPGYGDEFMPTDPLIYEDKEAHVKEVFLGDTGNDGAYMVAHMISRLPWTKTDVDSRTLFKTTLRILLNIGFYESRRFESEYLPDDDDIDIVTTSKCLARTVSDVAFECPADIFSDFIASGNGTVYRYIFDHRPTNSFWEDWVDVTHSDDILFFLGTIHASKEDINATHGSAVANLYRPRSVPPSEYTFSDELVMQLGEFCKTGKPKIPKTDKEWPKYTKENKAYLILKPNDYKVAHGPRSTKCHLWEPYLVKRKATTPHPTPAQKPRPTPKRGHEKRPKIKVQQLDNNIAAASRASATVVEAATFVLAAVTVLLTTREL